MDSNDDLGSLLLNDEPRTWNEQSEEAFLQNLFANTLLNDDFQINDNLDNLDTTNYSSVLVHPNVATNQSMSDAQSLDESLVANLEKNLEIIQQDEINKTKNEIDLVLNPMTDFVFNLDTSFNLTEQLNYNHNLNTIEPVDFMLDDNNSEMLKAMKLSHDSTMFLPTTAETTVESGKTVAVNEIQRTDDDMLFKKPTTAPSSTYLHSYFHSLPSNDSMLQLNQKLKDSTKNREKLRSESDSSDLLSQFKKINQQQQQQQDINIKEQKTLNDLNLSAVSYRQTREQKNIRGHSLTDSFEKDLSSSENNETPINISSLSSSPVASNKITNSCFSTSTSINKLFTLKRSRKRTSKLVSSNSTHSTSTSKTNKQPGNCLELAQKVTGSGNKQLKLNGQKKLTKKEKNEKQKQQQQQNHQRNSENSFSSSFEPLSKKFAIDKEPFQGLKFINGHHLAKCNKEEVELHIKELSLLDLHSSEDDSSDRLAQRNGIPDRDGQYYPTLTTSQSIIPVISIASETSITSHKQQTSETSFATINQENSISNSSINTVNYDGNSSSPENDLDLSENQSQRSKKYKQYWNKNGSIDSDSGVSIKSSCDSLSTKKKLKESKSQIVSLTTQSQSITTAQNKRKKQSNNEQSKYNRNGTGQTFLIDLSSSLHSVAKSSKHASDATSVTVLSESHSSNLDIDTLQHMKNLDLNQDLPKEIIPTSYSTVSIQTNTSSISSNSSDKSKTTDLNVQKPFGRSSQIKSSEEVNTNPNNSRSSSSINLDLNDKKSRQTLWNLLKAHSSKDEMIDQFGVSLHDKISFWDLVQLKVKYSTKNELKTIYEITDDYTKLYSNMSTLLEGFVKEHSAAQENSTSRSRSSSRNYRKT